MRSKCVASGAWYPRRSEDGWPTESNCYWQEGSHLFTFELGTLSARDTALNIYRLQEIHSYTVPIVKEQHCCDTSQTHPSRGTRYYDISPCDVATELGVLHPSPEHEVVQHSIHLKGRRRLHRPNIAPAACNLSGRRNITPHHPHCIHLLALSVAALLTRNKTLRSRPTSSRSWPIIQIREASYARQLAQAIAARGSGNCNSKIVCMSGVV